MYICFKLFKKSYIIQNDNLLNLTNETPNSMFIINRLSSVILEELYICSNLIKM